VSRFAALPQGHEAAGESKENLDLMRRIDERYLERPIFGSRKIAFKLGVNRKRVQRLMRSMGIEAIYPKRCTTRPAPGHEIYPYLLRNVTITHPDHVWSSDITYIPMQHGFLYLTAVIDWYSRYVLAWRLSNTLAPPTARGSLLCSYSVPGATLLLVGNCTDWVAVIP
jgi:putative transposase